MTQKIYLDNNATTAVAPEAREAMLPYFCDLFGNPSSGHRFGEAAKAAVETSREQVAALLHTATNRIFFTGGGTEANNLAIMSAVTGQPKKKHIISSTVEHPSVLQPLAWLASHGYTVDLVPVDEQGQIDLNQLTAAIRPDTALVSLMAANNETGVLFPIAAIGALCREKNVLFHCDAVQLAGKEPLDLGTLPVDYLTLGAHKLHGPKGVGALYASRTAPLAPFTRGAGQEHGVRPGTENVAGIVGFGIAAFLAANHLNSYKDEVGGLRDRLEKGILRSIADARINCHATQRLANTTNVSFLHASAAAIIQELDEHGIAVSAHSACHSGDLDPSHVLTAIKVPEEYIHGTLRISLCRSSTAEEITRLLAILPNIVTASRRTAAI